MNNKKKFSKTGIIMVASTVLVFVIFLLIALPGGAGSPFGGNSKKLNDEGAPGLSDVIEKGSPLMIFDTREETRALLNAFENDEINAVECEFVSASSKVKSEDEVIVTETYKALKNIVVGEAISDGEAKPDEALAEDSETASNNKETENQTAEYKVTFVLADKTKAKFEFSKINEETGIAAFKLNNSWYEITGMDNLADILKELQ